MYDRNSRNHVQIHIDKTKDDIVLVPKKNVVIRIPNLNAVLETNTEKNNKFIYIYIYLFMI